MQVPPVQVPPVQASLPVLQEPQVLPPQVSDIRSAESVTNLASSAYLLNEERPWITGDSANPRRAAVLGANFDAVNPVGVTAKAGRAAAIVLEEEPEDRL